MLRIFFIAFFCNSLLSSVHAQKPVFSKQPGLQVTMQAEPPTGTSVKVSHAEHYRRPGKTSIRYKSNKIFKVGEGQQARQKGYYERDRDLGQTFTVPDTGFYLRALTIKLADSLFAGANGAAVSVQLFEVSGQAVINDNGTTSGQVVHWTTEPWADDYITGEVYQSLGVFSGAVLPDKLLPQHYLRFRFPDKKIYLKAGTRYAFLLMFDQMGKDRGMALASLNREDRYKGGHGIRREAKGTKPVPNDYENSTFPPFVERVKLPPTTNGYPDVDTYRDFVFFVEGE